MSPEKTLMAVVSDVRTWLSGLGLLGIVLGFVFREFWTGVFESIGEWVALHLFHKRRVDHIRDKVETADKRGRLHNYLAEELFKVNQRLDCCERLHRERDKKDEAVAKKLLDCHEKREDLAIKHVKLVNEARAAAIENAKLLAENSSLRGRLEKV